MCFCGFASFSGLHVKYLSQGFIHPACTLALRTAREEFASLRLAIREQDELVHMTSAEETRIPWEFPTNGPNFPHLFLHQSPLQEMMPTRQTEEPIVDANHGTGLPI